MSADKTEIAIAGAGIGGLTAALAFGQRGIFSHIFERRAVSTEAGAGIQLGPNATGVLAKLGVLDSVRALSSEPDGLSIHDGRSGRVLSRFPLGAHINNRFGAPYLTLHRQDLHQALSSAAVGHPHIEISYGSEVVGFQNSIGGIHVTLANRPSVAADALIAADGLMSRLRSLVSEIALAPQPTGKLAFRSVVPREAFPAVLAANDVHIWMAPGAHVVHYPVRQGSEIAIVVVINGLSAAGGWDCEAACEMLTSSPVARFAAPVRELMSAAEDWRMWALQTVAPLSSWTKGSVALLGDAAHPILPFFAQGGGLAIEDAAVVAQCVAIDRPMGERLQAYEAARRTRANRVAAAAKTNGQIYHLSGTSEKARNVALAIMPASLMMRRYDWLYGWTP
jgi:salicylate hydroxylase